MAAPPPGIEHKEDPTLIKTIDKTTVIEQGFDCDRLVIAEGAELQAPEGKFLTLTVNGAGIPIEAGTYVGDIKLSVSKLHHMPAHGLHTMSGRTEELHTAIVVHNNELVEEECTPAIVQGGHVCGHKAENLYIASAEDDFNGILVTGTSEYTINNAKIDFDGKGANDFMGVGAGIAAMDNARVTINDSQITMAGRTRCAIHVAGDSIVEVNNCRISNHSFDPDAWMGDFSWGVGFDGSNRLVQLCDNGTAIYNNCDLTTNGWGVLSIDGCDDCVRYFIKDCRLSLSGPRTQGYGAFCIGDRNTVEFDHCKVDVNGYPLIVRGFLGRAHATVKNGTLLTGTHYGVFIIGDVNTPTIVEDSSIITGRSSFLVKASAADIHVERSVLKPANGTICQLMDNDEVNMWITAIPVKDTPDSYIEGRDLAAIDPANDVRMTFTDMDLCGNFFNSTTNNHAEQGCTLGMPTRVPFGGMFMNMAPPFDLATATPDMVINDYDARGPKNLEINLKNCRYEGVASSAVQKHRDDLTEITELTRIELSNVTQTAAPTVNNGVVVNIDRDSTWIVTGTSYLTKLTFEPGALLKAPAGQSVYITVDGNEVEYPECGGEGGEFVGKIVLKLGEKKKLPPRMPH